MSTPAGDRAPAYLTPALARWRRRTDGPLLVLAIGSLPLLLLESAQGSLSTVDKEMLDVVNVIVLVAFAVDYVVELTLATRRWHYVGREWSSLLIVLAQVAALGFALAGATRILRLGRVWRSLVVVARVVAIGGAAATEGRAILRDHAAGFALGVAGFTWITSAVGLRITDAGRNPKINSFLDALWWSSATITTVGYGDVYPVTGPGRVIGAVTMLVGIGSFAVVTAKVAEFLVRSRD